MRLKVTATNRFGRGGEHWPRRSELEERDMYILS